MSGLEELSLGESAQEVLIRGFECFIHYWVYHSEPLEGGHPTPPILEQRLQQCVIFLLLIHNSLLIKRLELT
ncbi:hypothetical protein MHYP_G00040840 [Metynnis hypsauchen]